MDQDRADVVAGVLNLQQEAMIQEVDDRTRLQKIIHVGKRSLQATVIAAELLPTNEAIRYGAFAAAQAATGDPMIGAAVLGGTTFAVEGAAALATADIVTTKTGLNAIRRINARMEDSVPPDAKMTPLTEAGIAMVGGSAVLMLAKQRQEPYRTTTENRRYGVFTASWMAGVFAVEGALLSAGVSDYTDPKKIGAALLAISASYYLPKKASDKLKENSSGLQSSEIPKKLNEITDGVVLSEEDIWSSYHKYGRYRKQHDQNVKLGVFGADLHDALRSKDTTLINYSDESGNNLSLPLFVPVSNMEWYNLDLLKKTYGEDKKFLYYAHPPLPEDKEEVDKILEAIKREVDGGAVVLTDYYSNPQDENGSEKILQQLSEEEDCVQDNFESGGVERSSEVFVAEVGFEAGDIRKSRKTIARLFREEVKAGRAGRDLNNGVSVVERINQKDFDRLWEVYKKPFDDLSEEHPSLSGFDRDTFDALLDDPEVIKIVNKVDGKISTLCMFVQDFEHCPWFNKKYYQDKYPQHYKTKNIFIFPGIVSDEEMRGSSYGQKVIDVATKLFAKRGSDVLITFECTETSARYVPKIVKGAINNSGVATVSDTIDEPDSVTRYMSISRK